jgi:hypothetical protein
MRLQEKMDGYKKAFEAKAPKDALAVMHRVTREIADSGILSRTARTGDIAPDFVLKNLRSKDLSLGGLIARGPLVLSFYRGRW